MSAASTPEPPTPSLAEPLTPPEPPLSPAPGPEVLLMGADSAKGASPPALPPRPRVPPRPVAIGAGTALARCTTGGAGGACWRGGGVRKYVFLCAACGGLSTLLGVLFLAVYFLLRSYTSSLAYFETVPTYVPASMLLSTGLVVMCLARRRNRYSFLIKLCGCACLVSAALCVLVTVATTVVHMSRLQSLSQCHYQHRTQTCTCYSALVDSSASGATEEGARYVFNATPDCDVIHGALYSCLRALFGLSVVGILACIFSGMLVYQLFSHEKKKMYWQQLEMRCRLFTDRRQQTQPHLPPHHLPPPHHCGCGVPWEFVDSHWAPGRVGNLYSPSPEDQPPTTSNSSAWSWRRLPWSRSTTSTTRSGVGTLCLPQSASSPDSQYGFSAANADLAGRDPSGPYLLSQVYPAPQPHPRPFAPGITDSTGLPLPLAVPLPLPLGDDLGPQFYLWGPPPPYMSNPASATNSPARRDPSTNTLPIPGPTTPPNTSTLPLRNYPCLLQPDQLNTSAQERSLSLCEDNTSPLDSFSSPEKSVPRKKRKKSADGDPIPAEDHKPASTDTPVVDSPESPNPSPQLAVAAFPSSRKTKKRSDAPLPPGERHITRYSERGHRVRTHKRPTSSGNNFCGENSPCCSRPGDASDDVDAEGYSYPRLKFPPQVTPGATTTPVNTTDSQAILAAFDNQAFHEGSTDPTAGPVTTITLGPQGPLVCKKRSADPSESEIYFGDDSSCCNVSEQHSSLNYEETTRPGRVFKLVHSHGQQRSMDSALPHLGLGSHRPSASTLSDSATVRPCADSADPSSPSYQLHPIDTTLAERHPPTSIRQRMPLPLPNTHSPSTVNRISDDRRSQSLQPALLSSRAYLAPDAQYESIADSNVYTYISALPLVHSQSANTSSLRRQYNSPSSKQSCDSYSHAKSPDEQEAALITPVDSSTNPSLEDRLGINV